MESRANMPLPEQNLALDGLLGLAIGDALGVPYEFLSRDRMRQSPAVDMIGHGTYNQVEGSWSDDTSMALCCADSLLKGFNPEDMMKKFSAWKSHAQYTATGVRFDIGPSTRKAIERFELGLDAADCGDATENGNGNGALMRIFPVSLMQCLQAEYSEESAAAFLEPVHRAASLTHAHERGLICCGIYTMILYAWINRQDRETVLDVFSRGFECAQRAYMKMGGRFAEEINTEGMFIHPRTLAAYEEQRIMSSGYVIHTLHAALWCLLTSDSYAACVLKAVNLGEDTDTTAAVAGALAGVVYGRSTFPAVWLEKLKNRKLIEQIAEALNRKLTGEKAGKHVIDSFTKEHAHMALKYASSIKLDGVIYGNAQAAYLAQGVKAENRELFAALNAHQARRLAKQLSVREGWDAQAQEDDLEAVCMAKYRQNAELAQKLLSTGEKEIIYDTTGAHDNDWGRCSCSVCADGPVRNLYGKILMRVRKALGKDLGI